MSLFDKKAAKNILLKQVEKQKAKLNTQSSTPAASSAYPSHHAPYPTSSHVPHAKPPPGYPSSSASHSAHAKKDWQSKVSQKLNDPAVKAKVEKKAKKKATKSIIKGVGELLFTAFEE